MTTIGQVQGQVTMAQKIAMALVTQGPQILQVIAAIVKMDWVVVGRISLTGKAFQSSSCI